MARNKPNKATPRRAGGEAAAPENRGYLYSTLAQDQLFTLFGGLSDVDAVLSEINQSRSSLRRVLMADDEVCQAVHTLRDMVIGMPWRLEPSEGPAAELIDQQLQNVFRELVLNGFEAWLNGYSVQDVIYRADPDRTRWERIDLRKMDEFIFNQDRELRHVPAKGATQADGNPVDQQFKVFLTRNDATWENPRGEAILSKVYWPWYFKTQGWRFWAQWLERFGSPILLGSTRGDTQMMATALTAAHNRAIFTMPDGDTVTALGTPSSSGSFEAFDAACTRRIQKIISGQTLTANADGKTSTNALGAVHFDVLKIRCNSIREMIRTTIQRMIDALLILNGLESVKLIWEEPRGLNEERAARDQTIKSMGDISFTRSYYEDMYGYRESDIVHVSEKPAATSQTPQPPKFEAATFATATPRFTPDQQKLENIGTESLSKCGQPIPREALMKAVAQSKDPADLERRLYAILGKQSQSVFNQALAEAVYEADLQGWADSHEGR